MIITTLEELRLFSPSNAIDNITSLTGFINSSEQDFMREKLGKKLYAALVLYYNTSIRDNVDEYISAMETGQDVPAYARLLYLCQKAVTYDALARAVSLQAVSINGMGVNVGSSDNYKPADRDAIADFKKSCVKEAHSAVNELLETLEDWAGEISSLEENEPADTDVERAEEATEPMSADDADSDIDTDPDSSDDGNIEDDPDDDTQVDDPLSEEREIVNLWKQSRYYYLVTSLLIPSAVVLQEYFNIYESREKYIQMVPELRYIQEDILSPIFGEELIEFIALFPWSEKGLPDKIMLHVTHNLRKIAARYLEMRLIKPSEPRHEEARNEAVKLTNRLTDYLHVNQELFNERLTEVYKTSPLYVASIEENPVQPSKTPLFQNNNRKSVMFVTPGLI